jgi:hypothetical protein
VPSGLADYLDSHRDELETVFAETQGAIASGDLDALTAQLAASAEEQADALIATLPESAAALVGRRAGDKASDHSGA